MHLARLLKSSRTAIVERWADLALRVYPRDATGFLSKEKDRFRNPVGHATRDGLGVLLDGLLESLPPERTHEALDGIVRIRAVQELTPSQAVGFVFLLKQVVRDAIGEQAAGEAASSSDLSALDQRIDRLALAAFDHYVRCREKVYDLRLGEIKRRTSAIRQRVEETGPDANGGCGA